MSNITPTPRHENAPAHLKVELIISDLLRIGVIASLFLVTMGTTLTFVHHHDYLNSRNQYTRLVQDNSDFPSTLRSMWEGLRSLEGRSVVVLGLLLLIATPVMRVAVSVVVFAVQKDTVFVVLTTVVLTLLLLSFFLGKVEG